MKLLSLWGKIKISKRQNKHAKFKLSLSTKYIFQNTKNRSAYEAALYKANY